MCHTIHLPPFYLFVPNSSESADDECRLTISCQRCSLRRQKDAHCQRIRRQEYKNLFTHTHTYAKPRVPSLNLFHPHRPSCDVCVLFDRADAQGHRYKGRRRKRELLLLGALCRRTCCHCKDVKGDDCVGK